MINGENKTMRLLTAFGIIFIVCGHIGLDFFTIGDLFPYYSFHVFIFLFVSGYFYDAKSQDNIGRYILKKARHLLIPYFIFNLIYGIIVTALNAHGFSLGQNISLYNLIVAPFLGGHQFMLNAPSWFLIALFEIECVNVIFRWIMKKLHLSNELLIFALTLILGVTTIFLAIEGHVWGHYKDIGRILIMLPGYEAGKLYKEKIEIHVKKRILTDAAVAIITIVIQLIVKRLCAGLAFSTVWVTGFANGPIVPYVTVITGIAFWYCISDIIVYLMSLNEYLIIILDEILTIGRHSMSIMLNHIFICFLINSIILKVYLSGNGFALFDETSYRSDVYYVYTNNGLLKPWGYLIFALIIPMFMGVLWTLITKKFKKLIRKDSIKAVLPLILLCACIPLLMTGCTMKYERESMPINTAIDIENIATNPNPTLSVPTYATKIKDKYFIVDCYNNKVIYNDNLTDPLYEWKVMTDNINRGHTIVSDGLVYLIDDTENDRVLIMEERTNQAGETVFVPTQEFLDIGERPHFSLYDEETDTFYVWSSMTGEMYLFRHEKDNPKMYLTQVKQIPELIGYYVRTFTIIDDKIYFVSGNKNILEVSLDKFEIINRYPVPDEIAGMVQLTKIQDYYYITVSTDAMANQSAATMIRAKYLTDLGTGNYEDVYENFIGGGTPYCITQMDGLYYLCEHRIPGHSLWSFDVVDNEIVNPVTVY